MLQILLDHFRNMMKHILGCCNRRRLQFIHDTVIYKINIGIPNLNQAHNSSVIIVSGTTPARNHILFDPVYSPDTILL